MPAMTKRKSDDASTFEGSLRLARAIKNYWLERGRDYEPVVHKLVGSGGKTVSDEVGRAVWGLRSQTPVLGGVPPRLVTKGGLIGETY